MSLPAHPAFRIGHGFDVHAFGPGDHVMLGGVRVPHAQGLVAHSDGDVVLHAVCDALLGALALGDVGAHFPPSDLRWKGADSRTLLRTVFALVAQAGWRVANVDATVMAEAPRIREHVDRMRQCIAEDIGCDAGAVSVKGTTTEQLGFVGRREGIAAAAVVLLVRFPE